MLPNELIKASLKPAIIKILQENGRMYGFEITCRLRELTGGKMQLSEGALYPALHKMVAEKILIAETELFGRRERRYYRLTEDGTPVAKLQVAEFRGFIETMKHFLES